MSSSVKPKFGPCKSSNTTWKMLCDRLTIWANANNGKTNEWLKPTTFAKTIETHFMSFDPNSFRYAYKKCCEHILEMNPDMSKLVLF